MPTAQTPDSEQALSTQVKAAPVTPVDTLKPPTPLQVHPLENLPHQTHAAELLPKKVQFT